MSKDYDFCVSGVPVNKTAARVLRGGDGFQYSVKNENARHYVSTTPPPLFEWKGPREFNMTGQVIGDMTVIGYGGKGKSGKKQAKWVCRCRCGNHQFFHRKALISGKNLKCDDCRKIEYYKTGGNK